MGEGASRSGGAGRRARVVRGTGASPVRTELEVYRFLDHLARSAGSAPDLSRLMRVALREIIDFFGPDAACVAAMEGEPEGEPVVLAAHPRAARWDLDLLGAFIRGRAVPPQPDTMLARVKRRGRPWGVVAMRFAGRVFDWDARDGLRRIAESLEGLIAAQDDAKLRQQRSRLDRKMMEQVRPRDLFYHVLDALRTLTRYDHSATFMIAEPEGEVFEVVAEQIAWTKRKSDRIGARIAAPHDWRRAMVEGMVWGLREETGGGWTMWTGEGPRDLVRLLGGSGGGVQRERDVLAACLRTREGVTGVLRVAALHPRTFGEFEAKLLGSLLPPVSVALQNSRRAESLTAKMIEAERKHAIADLVRGVSHDVNNALGSVLPLVQQMRADVEAGASDAVTLSRDLEQVERSVRVCARIFGGMLGFARRGAAPGGRANVAQAVADASAILSDGIGRRGATLERDVADDTGEVDLPQSDLEQLCLNLISNARDATGAGGRITVRARAEGAWVVIEVEDTGVGISREHLPRVMEPFFTTKERGTGLGLAICRSIAWRCDGELTIRSEVGVGTVVRLRVPRAGESAG